ncbi:MAG: hypothetical protein WCQ99_07655 [Pseudomonadota bacterium]
MRKVMYSKKIQTLKVKIQNVVFPGFILVLLCSYSAGCSEQEKPPYFSAEVINVYNEKTEVENFKLLYWWQERGETPFLKTYTYHAKEVVGEIIAPANDDPSRVTITNERIAFQNIKFITSVLAESGKSITITTADGREMSMTGNFPKTLKKDEQSGVADNKLFVEGYVRDGAEKKAFKLEFNYIKKIIMVKASMQQGP